MFTEGFRLFGFELKWYHLLSFLLISVLLIWEGNRFIESKLPQLYKWSAKKIHPLVIFFLLSLVNVLLATFLVVTIINLVIYEPDESFMLHVKLALGFGFRVNLFLNCLNAIYYFMNEFKRTQLEAEQLKKVTIEAQFEALRNQINPHFLFNSLNVLSTLVYKDADTSSEFINQLSKVYRYLLYHQEKKIVELREELDFLNSYIYLLNIRFKDNLKIVMTVPEKYHAMYIAPASLQLLIENAIKHNVVSSKKPLVINIFTDDSRYIIIENNFQEKSIKEPSTSVGLKNISLRYEFISNEKLIVEHDDTKFVVKVPLIALADI
ncbi:MAG: sensor histidine kinase [Cyclobacteriaceae bacterium]